MQHNLKKRLLFIILIAIVSFALAFLNNQMITNTITGEVISDILGLDKTTFTTGERITGNLRITLEDEDLIPNTTVVNLLIGKERPATPIQPDENARLSPPDEEEEGEGEIACNDFGACCYPGTGLGNYYGIYDCGSPRSECWSSCSEIRNLSMANFILLSTTPGRGEYIFGAFNNIDGPSPSGQGYGFSGCDLDLTQCEIYGGECVTSCSQGFKEDGFSCTNPVYPGGTLPSPPNNIEEGESEGEGIICCIPTSYNTPCELAGGTCAESCDIGYVENSLSCGEINQEGELLCCAKQYTCDGWSNAYTTAISNFNINAPSTVGTYLLTMEIKSNSYLGSTTLFSSATSFSTVTPSGGGDNGDGDNGDGGGWGRSNYCGDSRCTGIETSITCPQDCGEEGTDEDIVPREDDSGTNLEEEEKKDLWLYYVFLPIIIIVVVALLLILYFRKRGKESENIQKVKSNYPRFTQTIQRKPYQ